MRRTLAGLLAVGVTLVAAPVFAGQLDRSSTGEAVQARYSVLVHSIAELSQGLPEAEACRAAYWSWSDSIRPTLDRVETYLILDARITDPASRQELQAYFASRDDDLSIPHIVAAAQVREACSGAYTFPGQFERASSEFLAMISALQAAPE